MTNEIVLVFDPIDFVTRLQDLTDVNIPAPLDGEVLTYDLVTDLWVSSSPLEGPPGPQGPPGDSVADVDVVGVVGP